MWDGKDHDRILISKTDKRAKSPRRIQMRKIAFLASLLALLTTMAFAGIAQAEPMDLPDGVKVGVVEYPDDNTAIWYIRGVSVSKVEIYGGRETRLAKLTKVGDNEVRFEQKRGTWWNFTFGSVHNFAFFSPQNEKMPLPWMTREVAVIQAPGETAALTARKFLVNYGHEK